jgi:hypothetical protein
VQANDPSSSDAFLAMGQLSEPPRVFASSSGGAKVDAGGHRLWVTGQYSVKSENYPENGLDEISEDELEDVSSDDDEDDQKPKSLSRGGKDVWTIAEEYVWHVGVLLNMAILLARASSTSVEHFWYLITFTNVALFRFLTKEKVGGIVKPDMSKMTPKMARRMSNGMGMSMSNMVGGDTALEKDKKGVKHGPEIPTPSTGGYQPLAGTTSMRIQNPTDLPVNKDGQIFAGWRVTEPETMLIRSHGYKSTKKKVPSAHCLTTPCCDHSRAFPFRKRTR